jgi:hypothetical protein
MDFAPIINHLTKEQDLKDVIVLASCSKYLSSLKPLNIINIEKSLNYLARLFNKFDICMFNTMHDNNYIYNIYPNNKNFKFCNLIQFLQKCSHHKNNILELGFRSKYDFVMCIYITNKFEIETDICAKQLNHQRYVLNPKRVIIVNPTKITINMTKFNNALLDILCV